MTENTHKVTWKQTTKRRDRVVVVGESLSSEVLTLVVLWDVMLTVGPLEQILLMLLSQSIFVSLIIVYAGSSLRTSIKCTLLRKF